MSTVTCELFTYISNMQLLGCAYPRNAYDKKKSTGTFV